MIIVMNSGATKEQVDHIIDRVQQLGLRVHPIYGELRTVIACVGDEREKMGLQALESVDGVERVVPILKPFKLASKEWSHAVQTSVKIRTGNGGPEVVVGPKTFVVMAGPCSVESRDQILLCAEIVKKAGATVLRGGAFKPRTSPYSFQGLEEEGLKLLAEAREKTGLAVVTEVITPTDVALVAEYADVMQIGARNMQNFALLKEVGKIQETYTIETGDVEYIE